METVLTRNVSSNGSSVITTRKWQSGEHVQIKRLSANVWLQARVIYCHPLDRGEFYVGLEFRAGAMDGEARPAYADFLSCETV